MVHHFPRCDEHSEDDATFASIYHVVNMVAQMDSSPFQTHWCSIWIGGPDFKISGAPIEAMDFSLGASILCDPVVSGSMVCSQFLMLSLRENDRQRCGLSRRRVFSQRFRKWHLTSARLRVFKRRCF
jgi:hypothetical protein